MRLALLRATSVILKIIELANCIRSQAVIDEGFGFFVSFMFFRAKCCTSKLQAGSELQKVREQGAGFILAQTLQQNTSLG